MRRLSGRRVAAGVLVGLTVPLAGCGSPATAPAASLAPLTSTAAPASPADSSSASPSGSGTSDQAAPQPDPRISEPTAAGAEAAVRHYFALLNFGFSGGDPRLVRAFSDADCDSCQAQLAAWEAAGADLPVANRGELVVLSAQADSAMAATVEVIVSATRRQSSVHTVTSTSASGDAAAEATYRFDVRWTGERWSIADYEALGDH